MPIGVPMRTANTVSSRLPTIGLSSPPPEPGGGVISVKTDRESPENPSHSSTVRMTTSHPSPSAVAASERPITSLLGRRRARYRRFMASPDAPLDAQQQITRNRQHDEGDDEQDQPERDQRRGVEVADRLGELVGDGRRDGGPGGEQG